MQRKEMIASNDSAEETWSIEISRDRVAAHLISFKYYIYIYRVVYHRLNRDIHMCKLQSDRERDTKPR